MKLLKEILFGFLFIVGLVLAASESDPLADPAEMIGIANLIGLCLMFGAVLIARKK